MKKNDVVKVNKSNSDIWAMLKMAVETKNFALIESTLSRLHRLQKYYIDLITFQEIEINQLKDLLAQETEIRESFERDWLIDVAKKNNTYERLKERIDATYKKI